LPGQPHQLRLGVAHEAGHDADAQAAGDRGQHDGHLAAAQHDGGAAGARLEPLRRRRRDERDLLAASRRS
jgi:hypothetical protein